MSGFPERVEDAVRLSLSRPASAPIAGRGGWLSALNSLIARDRSISAPRDLRCV
jgi:hypothetical protein